MALIDIVQFHGNDKEFVWKFPSENLRLGTQLVVKPAQVAFFVYRGQICDEVKNGAITLTTANIPFLTTLMSLPFGGDSPFQAEVWFVNLISKLDNKWGTLNPIQLEDPKYNIIVPVRAFGQFGFRVANPRCFLEGIVGAAKVFTANQIIEYFKGVLLQAVNVCIGRAFVTARISILEAPAHLNELAEHCAKPIQKELSRFGVELVNFFFHSINVPEEDESYQRLKQIKTKEAELKVLGREIYQFDRSMDVLKTAAANEGGGAGLIQTGMGLAVGTNVGQQMMNQSGFLQTTLSKNAPPQLPFTFHVALNGQDAGAHDIPGIMKLVESQKMNGSTLVWRDGLNGWQRADEQPELKILFQSKPPSLPAVPNVPSNDG